MDEDHWPDDKLSDDMEASRRTSHDLTASFDHEKQPTSPTSTTTTTTTTSPPPPPNGGYGWVCTAACFTINAHTWGINSTYGVFLAHYLATSTFPGASPLEYAFVGGLSISCALLVAPLATLSVRTVGTKPTLFLGVALQTASLIGASFAHRIWELFLSQGVCFGVGMGFLFVASVGIPPQWFTTRRSLANGIAASGSGVGGLVYSLAAGAMIRSIGLGWTFRVLGIVSGVVNCVCALLLRDRNKIVGSRQSIFDVRLFERVEYWLLAGFGWFSMLGYVVLLFSLANYANSIGLTANQAAIVSALLNLGQAMGRPPVGYFSDKTGRINMACLTTFLCGIFAFAIWIPAKSYGVLIFYAIVSGLVAGTFWATIGPLTAEVAGLKRVPSALNIIWLVIVLPCAFSEPIALEIIAGTGKYLGTQLWTGFMYTAAAICLFFLRGWKIGELREIARSKEQPSEKINAIVENEDEAADRARAVGRRKILADCWRLAKV